jgi:hypothetical protein
MFKFDIVLESVSGLPKSTGLVFLSYSLSRGLGKKTAGETKKVMCTDGEKAHKRKKRTNFEKKKKKKKKKKITKELQRSTTRSLWKFSCIRKAAASSRAAR